MANNNTDKDLNVVCYKTPDGAQEFLSLRTSEIPSWLRQHSRLTVQYMFPVSADTKRWENDLRTEFLANCTEYGLQPDDLHQKFVDSNSHIVELLGFRTANRKYKLIVWDETTKRRVKCSAAYARRLTRIDEKA